MSYKQQNHLHLPPVIMLPTSDRQYNVLYAVDTVITVIFNLYLSMQHLRS